MTFNQLYSYPSSTHEEKDFPTTNYTQITGNSEHVSHTPSPRKSNPTIWILAVLATLIGGICIGVIMNESDIEKDFNLIQEKRSEVRNIEKTIENLEVQREANVKTIEDAKNRLKAKGIVIQNPNSTP